MQRSYQYGGEYKEYHLVGSTVIALIFKSGDGSGKSRPLGQSLSRTWSNKKSSLTIKPSGLFASHSVSIFILQTEALKASCLFQGFQKLQPGDVDALNTRCGTGSWVVLVEPQGSLVGR